MKHKFAKTLKEAELVDVPVTEDHSEVQIKLKGGVDEADEQ